MATLAPGRRVVAAMLANGVSSSCLRQDGRRPVPVRPARMAQGLRWCLWASRLFNSAGFRNKRAIPAGRCDRSEKTSYRILTVPTRAGGSRIFGRRHPTVKGTAMKADSRNSPTAVLFANSLRTRNIPRIRRLASLLQSCGPARIQSASSSTRAATIGRSPKSSGWSGIPSITNYVRRHLRKPMCSWRRMTARNALTPQWYGSMDRPLL